VPIQTHYTRSEEEEDPTVLAASCEVDRAQEETPAGESGERVGAASCC